MSPMPIDSAEVGRTPSKARNVGGFVSGTVIDGLGGLIGLGGTEFRLPLLVGFARYSRSGAFAVLRRERPLFVWMAAGSMLGAGIGGLLLGAVPADLLIAGLGLILLISAVKVFTHAHE